MVIIFKKGNRKYTKNDIPIGLLSNIYKLYTKITATWLDRKLDENQPREEVGFRSKYAYSPTHHIHVMCSIVYSNHGSTTLRFAYVLEWIKCN